MYGMKKWLYILTAAGALLAFQQEGRAQILTEKGQRLWDMLMRPNKNLDSVYVFQPFKGWDFSANYQGRWENASLEVPVEMNLPEVTTEATVRINMIRNQSNSIGLRAGYGPISLGYSVAVGKSKKPDRHFSFDWITNAVGVQLYYIKLHDTAESFLEYPDSEPVVLPEEPSLAHTWRVSGYYVFNHKKFSYPAAYRGKVIQRKSAGSIIAGAKFHHASLTLDNPKSIVGSLIMDLTGYSTYQFSLGAGYSYNWVLYHRDARSTHDFRDLRNLTLNVTAIPLLTVVNEIRMTHVIPPGDKEEIFPAHGGLRPNAIARAGVCYSFGHFYICSNVDFHFQHFHSREFTEKDMKHALPKNINYTYSFSVLGFLSYWSAALEFHYRF